MNREDGQVYSFVYCNFLILLSTTVCSQNINKQILNIADETLTDYSFLSRYHYTKSKNYLKRRYQIHHWIPMFIGTPCTTPFCINFFQSLGESEGGSLDRQHSPDGTDNSSNIVLSKVEQV